MAKNNIIELVRNNLTLGETSGINALDMATQAVNAAEVSLGKEDMVPWNKRTKTESLISGTSEYTLGDDILTDYVNIRDVMEIWRTDQKSWRVEKLPDDKFNPYRRGDTNTGYPYYFCQRNNSEGRLAIEIYKVTDSNYPIWMKFRLPLAFEDIPEEYNDLVYWRAMIFSAGKIYPSVIQTAMAEHARLMDRLSKESDTKWTGTFIVPDIIFGDADKGRLSADSSNLWGKL